MSVPIEQIAAGRYYRTSIGGKPCVVRAEYETVTGWMCRGISGAHVNRLKLLKPARLFTEVIAAGDGSGRWVEFERAAHEAKLTAALWRQDARP